MREPAKLFHKLLRMEKGKKDTHLSPDLWPLILEIRLVQHEMRYKHKTRAYRLVPKRDGKVSH